MGSIIRNFPIVEDDFDSLTDYQLFSKFYSVTVNEFKKLKDVAYTADYNDLINKPEIPDISKYVTKDTKELEYYTLTSDLSSVALTGNYNDLSNKPTIPDVSNFITKDTTELENYTLTSDLASVALSGSYNDLNDKPTIPDVSNFITKDVNNLTYYYDKTTINNMESSVISLIPTNKPTIPDVSNFITKDVNDLTNYTLTSNLSSVALSGSYNDLSNKPTIPSVIDNLTSTSTTNSLSANQGKVLNDKYNGTTLFSGNLATNITLSDNKTNYTYLEIYYVSESNNGSIKVTSDVSSFGLSIAIPYSATYIRNALFSVTNNSINCTNFTSYQLNDNGISNYVSNASNNTFYITKVIGYK